MQFYRLKREIRDIRQNLKNLLTSSLGEWYNVSVYATNDHVADRLLDRSESVEKGLNTMKEILDSLGRHYSCNLLHYALKSGNMDLQTIIVYRKIKGRTFAIPLTAKVMRGEVGKPTLVVSIRTVIPEYVTLEGKNSIHINYEYPKIVFEYDGYRRVLSRLTRLMQSEECPEALRVLRT